MVRTLSQIRFKKISNQKHFTTLKKDSNLGNSKKLPALFFDRDGVIIKDNHYISKPQDVEILEGIKKLLKISKNLGWANIVITNH